MAYDLSFSEEFFILPGELYDGAEYPHGDRPYSVLGAIRHLAESNKEEWENMCLEVFECDSEFVTIEMVMDRIRQTGTCRDIRSPVEVYIDDQGWFSVHVYGREGRPEL